MVVEINLPCKAANNYIDNFAHKKVEPNSHYVDCT